MRGLESLGHRSQRACGQAALMTATSRRLGHREPRGAAALDAPPPCAWCDSESATAIVSIEADEGHTAALALGPSCLRRLTALGLSIQADTLAPRGA